MKIEGRNAITEALKSDTLTVEKIIMPKKYDGFQAQKLYALAKSKGVRVEYSDLPLIKDPQAFVSEFQYCEIEDILAYAESKNQTPFIILTDGIEDPHNLGSIIRVAECAGVHGVVIPKRRSVSVNETVMRTSAGAAAHIRVCKADNINNVVRFLKESFITVYAAEIGGESIYKQDFTKGACFVIGGENSGVRRLTREMCKVVSIPMFGQVGSLNASVATGIAVYEALRQRLGE